MNEADAIWDELDNIYRQWGIREIPFSESAVGLGHKQLQQVFTGRRQELNQVFSLLRGRERKRILAYGWMGIGKTAFILEVLAVLKRKSPKTLAAYIALEQDMDLATAALIALAREMPEDEWAQHQLTQMGLLPGKRAVKKKTTVKAGIAGTGAETEEETLPVSGPQFPATSFEGLLDHAYKKYDRVLIAIDDLDKRDPAQVRQLLRDAQGMLKAKASFMLSGHPDGLTRDLVTQELGLFDLAIHLQPLDQDTTYRMLVNYLNSVRPEENRRTYDEPQAVWPFTPETARLLCQRSEGIPRILNRLGNYVLLKAAELNAGMITPDILKVGFAYADHQLRGSPGLSTHEQYVLQMVLEKGAVSDETITLDDLEKVRAKEFREIMPILEKLVQLDVLRRLPSERSIEYGPSPLLLTEDKLEEPKE